MNREIKELVEVRLITNWSVTQMSLLWVNLESREYNTHEGARCSFSNPLIYGHYKSKTRKVEKQIATCFFAYSALSRIKISLEPKKREIIFWDLTGFELRLMICTDIFRYLKRMYRYIDTVHFRKMYLPPIIQYRGGQYRYFLMLEKN